MKQTHEQSDEQTAGHRLQKVLAAAGLGSRRDCEEYIRQGRVEVDRKVVTELGTRVDPQRQEIRVDGEAIRRPKKLYFVVNKPIGVVTTNDDPSGRARVVDLVPTEERVFAVGRLDRSSEGLILVTNDGEFANRITHPRYGVEKAYLVRVAGSPTPQQLMKLKKGVHLAEGYARAQSIAVKKQHGHSTDLVIVLNEGRNREIRRILARVGHKVLALKRIAVGPVKLGDLALGESRRLMPDEIATLLAAAKEKRRTRRTKDEGRRAKDETRTNRRPVEDRYVQKQALLAEPLSLDDLLKDDLDEGPLVTRDFAENLETEEDATKGGVIDYEADFSSPPPKPKKGGQVRRKKHGRKPRAEKHERRPRGAKGERRELEDRPREDYGKKRGGKRVFGPREKGDGPAGEKAGNLQFRFKRKKNQKFKPQSADNTRRGDRRGGKPANRFGKKGGKQAGKQGGKRKGRR